MTDKERLENIKFLRNSEKTVAPGMQPSELISRKDVDWLINRVDELEQQNKRYREALTYYAEESNYDYDVRVDSISYVGNQSEMKFYRLDSEILHDRGEKARQALEGEE